MPRGARNGRGRPARAVIMRAAAVQRTTGRSVITAASSDRLRLFRKRLAGATISRAAVQARPGAVQPLVGGSSDRLRSLRQRRSGATVIRSLATPGRAPRMPIVSRPAPIPARRGTRALMTRNPAPAAAPPSATPVRYRFTGFSLKWRFEMLTERVSTLNRAPVRIGVAADSNGLPVDPTAATISMAFIGSPYTKPTAGDWKAATWDVTLIGSYVMECLVGPGGTVTLAQGGYYVWAKVTDSASGEQPVEQVARLFVD